MQSLFCLWLNRLFIFNHFRCQTFMKQEESLHFNVKHNFFLFVPFPIILLGQLNKSYHFWYYIFPVLTLEESQRETITCTFFLWRQMFLKKCYCKCYCNEHFVLTFLPTFIIQKQVCLKWFKDFLETSVFSILITLLLLHALLYYYSCWCWINLSEMATIL